MDSRSLIERCMKKTKEMFYEAPLRLHKSDLISHQGFLERFAHNKLESEQSEVDNQVFPPPTAVIDTRDERAREEGVKSVPEPSFHRNWINYGVITGHNGWVQAVSVDPSNKFFVTGSGDRMIKFWDLAKAELMLTLTGHIGGVMDLELSKKSPYLFSCCDAKEIYCWDLNTNSIIRDFHGHLSGVYCLSLHPVLDIFASGGRDSVGRVWDIRTRQNVFVLEGHNLTVFDIIMQEHLPNIITASADGTIRTWDLRNSAKCIGVLTRHAKSVRALASHPSQWSFVSASQDSMYQWNGQDSNLFKEYKGHDSIKNAIAVNEDNVMVSAGDDGTLVFWDWNSGTPYQRTKTIPQPGSLECESGIYDCAFDMTGTRLITAEADKTIKLWKQRAVEVKP